MGPATRLAIAAPVLAGLAWAASHGFDAYRVDTLTRAASTEMATWAAAGTQPAAQTWTSVHENLAAAERIRPNDPLIHELMGMLGAMRRDSSQHMDEGLAHLTKALELRPVSPYSWANLAEIRYMRGEPGANLELPLTRAIHLGPSEPGVQRTVADLGMAVWGEVTPTTQAQIDRTIATGMRRNPLEMLRISDRRGRLEAACRHVIGTPTRDPRVGRYCGQWEITP